MRDHPIDELVPGPFPQDRRRRHGRGEPAQANPPKGLVADRFLAADLHRLGRARIEVAGLDERHQACLETGRTMGRQVLEAHASVFELAHERRVLDERRHDHDFDGLARIEEPSDQARAQDVAGRCAARNRDQDNGFHERFQGFQRFGGFKRFGERRHDRIRTAA
jgi:hypothetical protein